AASARHHGNELSGKRCVANRQRMFAGDGSDEKAGGEHGWETQREVLGRVPGLATVAQRRNDDLDNPARQEGKRSSHPSIHLHLQGSIGLFFQRETFFTLANLTLRARCARAVEKEAMVLSCREVWKELSNYLEGEVNAALR